MDHIEKLSYCWSYSKLKVAIKRYMLNNTLLSSPQHLKSLSNYLRWKPLKLFSSIYTCLVKLVLNLIEKNLFSWWKLSFMLYISIRQTQKGKTSQKIGVHVKCVRFYWNDTSCISQNILHRIKTWLMFRRSELILVIILQESVFFFEYVVHILNLQNNFADK